MSLQGQRRADLIREAGHQVTSLTPDQGCSAGTSPSCRKTRPLPNWSSQTRRFLSSPNFISWFSVRKEEANQKLRLIHLDQLCKADIGFWMRDKQEVEIVDFLLQVKECLSRATRQYPSVSAQTVHTLQSQIRTIISSLPEDLQSCLKSSFSSP
ncbi:Protein DENND6B [Geodia barretti]|uniref:Protein DENND6B n=1 Tax=Geodia barretti TaxID=519541 RepID=A0AA35XKV8_GEOBA|nr:Protein DENND6B [Geodia barretti]